MTAGRGISHSEVSPASTTTAARRAALGGPARVGAPHRPRASTTTRRRPVTGDGWRARVFLGSLLGDRSPVTTYSPLLGAELLLEPRTQLDARRRPRRSSTACSSTPGSLAVAGQEIEAERARLRPARLAAARARGVRRAGPAAAARRRAVRGVDRDVVELRRAAPTRRSSRSARSGRRRSPLTARSWPTARTSRTAGSGWWSATTCPRSRPRRCRTCGSSTAADPRRQVSGGSASLLLRLGRERGDVLAGALHPVPRLLLGEGRRHRRGSRPSAVPRGRTVRSRRWPRARPSTRRPASPRCRCRTGPQNMLPFTNAPTLPNIGFTSTPGASGTRARKRALSSSLCLGICMRSSCPPASSPGNRCAAAPEPARVDP